MEYLINLANKFEAVESICLRHHEKINSGFDYIIVVDFEATFSRTITVAHEIIEFPALLFDLESNETIEQFHHYVKPTETPILSKDCIKLTGIQQHQVDASPKLDKILNLYDSWLKGIIKKYDCDFQEKNRRKIIHATWTDWDFGTCLFRECTRKKLSFPDYFMHRIDLKKIFTTWAGTKGPSKLGILEVRNWRGSLGSALDFLKIGFIGRPHSGIDDSINTCRLLATMRSSMHNNGAPQ